MLVNSFVCFLLVEEVLGLDILNGNVFSCSFVAVPIFPPSFLPFLIKPLVMLFVSLSFLAFSPYFFVNSGGISKCLILVFDQSWGQRRIRGQRRISWKFSSQVSFSPWFPLRSFLLLLQRISSSF